ncbi:hypothetical protein ACTOB_003794 [Actinoplanes oblitus]|uniref:Multi-ubiquitin domain-containing protein n=1 Tax=Actinoplanes oblitus TaxID=3040509 RepID=A0ABY8WVN0_9ACTN|nr:hypothetical protein [Actinoplanes oblitus]WIN00111.1 hypothetical protein ACTOB_003794 [Actinoplanes oblitus]
MTSHEVAEILRTEQLRVNGEPLPKKSMLDLRDHGARELSPDDHGRHLVSQPHPEPGADPPPAKVARFTFEYQDGHTDFGSEKNVFDPRNIDAP